VAGEDLSHSINHIRQKSDSFSGSKAFAFGSQLSLSLSLSLSLCIYLTVLAPVSISLSFFVFYYMYLSGLVPCISTQRALYISLPEYLMKIFRLLSTFDLSFLPPPLPSSDGGVENAFCLLLKDLSTYLKINSGQVHILRGQKYSCFLILHQTVSMALSTLV